MNILNSVWIVAAGTVAFAGPIYNITDLGSLGGLSAQAYGLSSNGQAVGAASTPSGYTHAFSSSNGGITDLTMGSTATEGIASGVNGAGLIAGTQFINGQAFATVWANGAAQSIAGAGSYATAVGESGQVVGMLTTAGGQGQAFLMVNGSLEDLGTLSGGTWSSAYAVNSSNQVAGYGDIGGGAFRAYVWSQAGGYSELGTFGGTSSYAMGINDSGQAVGTAQVSNGYTHAFVLDGSILQDLGTLGGGSSYAYGINDGGDIVGYSWLSGAGDPHAFLYKNGQMFDLNSLINPSSGWVLTQAYSINSSGQIVGAGTLNGTQHAFLVDLDSLPQTPVASAIPEPGTWIAVAAGLSALLMLRVQTRPRLRLLRLVPHPAPPQSHA